VISIIDTPDGWRRTARILSWAVILAEGRQPSGESGINRRSK
jgi:hypothetical protein